MAKLTLTDLTQLSSNEASAVSEINLNNAAIETALENTLSLDGTSPNALATDLDINSNDILNAGDIKTTTLTLGNTVVSEASIINESPGGVGGPGSLIAQLSKTGDSGALSAHNNTEGAVIFDTEDLDLGGWIDVGVDGSKLTVPAGTPAGTRYTFYAYAGWTSVALRVSTTLYKNNAHLAFGGGADETFTNASVSNIWPGIPVAAGDEFEFRMYAEADGSLILKGGAVFGVMVA
jgi:hypothetical protein